MNRDSWAFPAFIIAISLVMLATVWALMTARAESPQAHPCKEGLLEWLERGDVAVCYGHLVPPETWLAAQIAVDSKGPLEERVRTLEEQVVNLRGQVAEERASGEARLRVCENVRGMCEAAKAPPRCRAPPLLSRGELAWPVGLGVGLLGGIGLDRWIGCR